MNDVFQQRVRAVTAIAGWWTVLIAIGFLAIVWFVFLALMCIRPTWMQPLFGPGVSWDYVQNAGFWAVSILMLHLVDGCRGRVAFLVGEAVG